MIIDHINGVVFLVAVSVVVACEFYFVAGQTCQDIFLRN
jgi:hypothetical protein